ncbi:hypothetical protein CXF83_14840 [Shewanella sp. Choline-02u-19]|uniref:hypothetical protein n=1 Tax=unclassified Shewanella TaxID=196818 RepID=UPI000C334E37|nr:MULTISPECIES: hypothetical protein [unclassified Shewanella]PKH57099.1 hypothetical protein CXF84_11550 [Shewanella sp. Bg11-22]PKI27896.1 hypothetical protein CXF83_14840 [Shewanella sp. Choline-02u-19]
MLEPLLIQPQIIEINHQSKLKLVLSEQFGNFSVLQLQSGPIAEVVVVSVTATKMSLMIRLHPYLSLDVIEANEYAASDAILNRSVGQGWRLFSTLGISPRLCAEQLRKGLFVAVSIGNGCQFNIVGPVKWELIPLEADFRLGNFAREIQRAKHIIARSMDLEPNAESLLVEISELDSICYDLKHFAAEGFLKHANDDISQLDAQLIRKRQLLSRLYSQLIERPNLYRAANVDINQDMLMRKLESYQLLAPPQLNKIVEQLMADDTESSFALEND